ncbi:hypothetical protein ZOSMA_67G00660 [Zostera marina]|uniref:Uncharacterized protein n=1 Tax=Zostera marina TaxID=29655 RepID=A0A0K9NU34_ZOSMR|nr:hypothetical protein ZOSMA_67G00660 [Zostera marina]
MGHPTGEMDKVVRKIENLVKRVLGYQIRVSTYPIKSRKRGKAKKRRSKPDIQITDLDKVISKRGSSITRLSAKEGRPDTQMGDPIKLTRRRREVVITDGGERRRAGHTYIASPGSELEGKGERHLSKTRLMKEMGEDVVDKDGSMSEKDVHQNVGNNRSSEMEDGKGGEEEGSECDEDRRTYIVGE